MDLKSVQQQLKADIAKHQLIMTQLKQNPQNEQALRSSLLEVQKHIAKLGTIQQQFGKVNKAPAKNSTDAKAPSSDNGCENKISETQKKSAGFIKLEPESSNQVNGNILIQSAISSKNSPTIDTNLNTKDTSREKQVSTVIVSTGNSAQLVYKNVMPSNMCGSAISYPSVASTTSSALKLETNVTRGMEPRNTSSSSNVVEKDASGSQPVSLKPIQDLFPNYANNNITTAKLPPHPGKNILVNSSMKLRAPTPNGGQFMLFPACVVKPSTPAMFRFTQPSQQSTNKSSARFWVNVGNPSSGSSTSRYVPGTVRSPNEGTEATGAYQKFRIISGNGCGAKENSQMVVNMLDNADVKPSNSQLKPVFLPPTSHVMTGNQAANLRTEQNKSKSYSIETCAKGSTLAAPSSAISSGTSEDAALTKNDSASNCFDKKVYFLGCIDLIPREKADRIRNRRYGKRRAVAHPVYSGGLYVSTAAGDSSKRMLPLELFDFESEPVPVKRPRGRPRGSTNKRSVSPPQSTGCGDDVFLRVMQQTKPPPTSEKRRPKPEDLCAICQKAGEVLMCDTCSQIYHVTCLTPPLSEVPSGMWYCDSCKEKFNNRANAPKWPGLMAIVHSYFSFNSQREEALVKARETNRVLKVKKTQLAERKKVLANILKEKISEKLEAKERLQENASKCEQLTTVMERIRVALNKSLDVS